MVAYKLVKLGKDGNIYPLFINKKVPFKLNEWMIAECFETKGFAIRTGFHCCFEMNAPHLKQELANGEKRVWVEVEVDDFEVYARPTSQGGKWILANKMKILKINP